MLARSLALVIFAAAASGCMNLGVVEPDKIYRSGQLDGEELDELITDKELKSVLNLRGPKKPGVEWYATEKAVCERRGVKLHSVRWSARRFPRTREVLPAIEALETGPFPMLIHCRAGADRTGLASAIYRIHIRKEPVDDAEDELTVWRGHLGFIGGTGELDEFLDIYEERGGGKPFKQWVEEDWPAIREEVTGEPRPAPKS